MFACAGAAVASDNLIGINFTTATRAIPDPQNWNRIADASGTLFNLTDDSGATTGVSVNWDAPTSNIAGAAITADLIPQHTYDLSGMIGYRFVTNDNVYSVTFSGLTPNAPYKYWFVAHRASLAFNQTVRVSNGDNIDAINFQQVKSGTSAFGINDQLSSDTQVWDDLAFDTFSSSTGTITFNWQRNASDPIVIGALAIQRDVPPEPFDVRIASSVSSDSVGVGENVTFTFDIFNPSPADVTGVVVEIELPSGLDYVSDDRSGTLVGNTLTASLGDLTSLSTTTINVITNPTAPGVFVVEAEVDINELDPNPDNNFTTASVNVGETDLAVAMVGSANPVVIATNPDVDFTIDYDNLGLITATDVQIVFTAPPELNITGASAGTISGNTVTLDIPSFSGANTGSFTVNTTAVAANPNALVTVEISHAGPDPDPSNDIAGVSLLIAQNASDFPPVRTIFSNVHTLDNSMVPGRPGERFQTGTGATTAFGFPFASPDGSLWIFRGFTDATGSTNVVVVGAEESGTVVFGQSQNDPLIADGALIGTIDERVSINDSGSWAARTRTTGVTPTRQYVIKFDAATAEFSAPIQNGDPLPGDPSVSFGTLFSNTMITNDGRVGAIATSLAGTTTDFNAAVVLGNQTIYRKGIDIPTGQFDGGSRPYNLFTANRTYINADGTKVLSRSDLVAPTTNNSVVTLDNAVVLQQEFAIPNAPQINGLALAPINELMTGSGNWMVRGNTATPEADRYILLNGEPVAWLGSPTGLPDNSVWDNSDFANVFFTFSANNRGDYVVGGLTDNPDLARDAVVVFYCASGEVFELVRESDPVDLSGNGQYDDNAFLAVFNDDRAFLTDTHYYFTAIVKDDFASTAIGDRFGKGFFRIELPDCGAPACPPDLNGDGVVDADDFFLFLQLFAAGDPRADFNNDGVIDADDFFAFL
ncbi:MAG: hypothetical protein EA423_00225, partial [Phycisphaerales bacterium]